MKRLTTLITAAFLLALGAPAAGQDDDAEQLKIAALEALISAPPERALPLAEKALKGDHSDEIKERALFVLSQINRPEAADLLLTTAIEGEGELQEEAIRMIGIGGNPEALARLKPLYNDGNDDIRSAVLEAFLIAGDEQSVLDIAVNAGSEDEFEDAVEMLAAMGARDELRQLREQRGMSESLIEAYAISGDVASLREIAMDASDPGPQQQAIEALGIVGGAEVDALLVEIYTGATSNDVREAALDGLLIAGHDEGVLELYRASDDDAEKRELLEYLVIMDSDAVWDLIDSALDGGGL
jgi:HEAT repeat protein